VIFLVKHRLVPMRFPIASIPLSAAPLEAPLEGPPHISEFPANNLQRYKGKPDAAKAIAIPPHPTYHSFSSPFQYHVSWSCHCGDRTEACSSKRSRVGAKEETVSISLKSVQMDLTFASTTQDPLVHHGRHFGRAVHTFCNIQTLITNGLVTMGNQSDEDPESMTAQWVIRTHVQPPNKTYHSERKEYQVFRELLRMAPGLEARLMESSEDEVIHVADLVCCFLSYTSCIEPTLTTTDPERG
jgi:hypothetical protein